MNPIVLYVGKELLNGVIQGVGQQLLQGILGGVKTIDVRTWVREAVAQIEEFVSEELRHQLTELVMKQMNADLQGVSLNASQYDGLLPEHRLGRKTLLEEINHDTGPLVSLALAYPQALFIAFPAIAYRFYALLALYDLDNDKGPILQEKPNVDQFLKKVSENYRTIVPALEPQNRIKVKCSLMHPGSEDPIQDVQCDVIVDGAKREWVWDSSEEAARRKADAVVARFAPPIQKDLADFQSAVKASWSKTVECYAAMCKKVDSSYAAPLPESFLLPPLTFPHL
jgi:hypothetical protein